MGSSFPRRPPRRRRPVWPCGGAATWSPTPRRIARRSRNENEQRIRRAASSVGSCTLGAGGVQVVRAGSFSRRHHRCSVGGVVDREPHCAVVAGVPGEPGEHPKIAGTVRRVLSAVRRNRCRVAALSQRLLSGDLASSRPVGSPRQVSAGDGPYALTSSEPCPHHRSDLRADRPTGPRCVFGGRRCTGTTAENHPVVWLDDPGRHIDGDYCPRVAGSRIRVATCESASQVGPYR
jgi:hypothetical protein